MGDGDQHARAGACFGRVFAYQKVFSTPSLNDAHVGGDSSSARATGRATSQVVAIRRMTATSVVAMGEDTTSIAGTDRAMLMLLFDAQRWMRCDSRSGVPHTSKHCVRASKLGVQLA